jgi:hypothetical protein
MKEDIFVDGHGDPLDLPAGTLPAKRPKQNRKRIEKDFLLADMKRLALGLDARGKVWADLLQQQRMANGRSRPIVASNTRLARLGMNRHVKTRALRSLEADGLIKILDRGAGNPRVKLLK